MKKQSFLFFVSGLLLTGCSTATISSVRSNVVPTEETVAYPVASVKAQNFTYYLFGFIPVFTGNPSRPNTKDYDLFEDRATPTTTEAMLEMAVERLRGDFLEDVHSNTVWTGSFSLWLVWQKQVSASGIVMANGPASEVSAETAESL